MKQLSNFRGCFVTGTDTGVGKTLISAALLHWCAAHGLRGVGYKPVAAGTQWVHGTWVNDDVHTLQQASRVPVGMQEVGPVQLARACAPHIAAGLQDQCIDLEQLIAQGQALTTRADALVVEGAGGFCVPLSPKHSMADVAAGLALPVVLVVGLRLGCINHALLTAQAVRARQLVLAGWVGNMLSEPMPYVQENIETLHDVLQHEYHAPCLGVVPPLQPADALHAVAHLHSMPLQALFQTSASAWCEDAIDANHGAHAHTAQPNIRTPSA